MEIVRGVFKILNCKGLHTLGLSVAGDDPLASPGEPPGSPTALALLGLAPEAQFILRFSWLSTVHTPVVPALNLLSHLYIPRPRSRGTACPPTFPC